MNKFILAIFSILIMNTPAANADVRNITEPYNFVYNIVNSAGAFVSGQTVALKIEKVSTGAFYDFSTNSFKTSGWTSKTTNLSADNTNGIYYYNFTPPVSETAQDQYIFFIDNSDSTYGDHQQLLLTYEDIASTFNVLKSRGR